MSTHPVLTRALRAAQLVLLLLLVACFACVQVNAAAYLSGRNQPAALDSSVAAVADVIAGLVIEAVSAAIVLIVAALLHVAVRERRKVITRA